MTTASKPRIATPVKRERVATSKPKTIKIGHGYYDLKLIRELVNTLPDGEVTLTSYAGKKPSRQWANDGVPTRIECQYPKGHFTLNANNLQYYAADNGKVKVVKRLTYYQGEDQPAKTFGLLAVELPMTQGGVTC